jgi:ribonucleoside-diphosphate reductase alpha chain
MYTYDEAIQESTKYFNGDDLASSVFVDKYSLKDTEGNILEKTPDDMHRRIAREIARIENNKFKKPLTENQIYNYLKDFKKIVPQGSPMYGIGNPYQLTTLSNCYVLTPPEDSYTGIHYTDEQISHISKRRGGCGIDISKLRPKGSVTRNSSRTSTGIIPFMERFSNSIREVGQCLIFNSLVLTDSGLKEIKDIIPNYDKVWTLNGWVKVINKINNGNKDLYKITTKKGFNCISTLDHVYLDSNCNEKKLQNFNIGDKILLLNGTNFDLPYIRLKDYVYESKQPEKINNLNKIKLPEVLNEDLAYLLGYSYGDGHFVKRDGENQSLVLSCNDDQIIEKLTNIIYNQFNYIPKNTKGSGNVRLISIHSILLCKWLSLNDISKEKSDMIRVPDSILYSNSKVQMAFFAGYFDADGYAHNTGKNVRVTSISSDFIYKLQKILLANGIIANIQIRSPSKINEQIEYRLNISGSYSQNKAKQIIDSIKIKRMFRCSTEEHNITSFNYKDINFSKGNLPKNYSFVPRSKNQNLSLNVLNRLKEIGEYDKELSFIDEITNIEYYSNDETYDLELEKEHLFWCEGFYVHNSGRRGALMITLDIHHPEALEFTKIKNDLTKITGANISLRLSDEFMRAVIENKDYEQRWPVDSKNPQIRKMVNAKLLWQEIIKNAHQMAEPGLLFWDNIIRNSPADCYSYCGFRTVGTNPCSELPLSILDSCRLLLQNIYSYVKNAFTDKAFFDIDEFFNDAKIAQRLMDDIVDLEIESINKIINKIKNDPEPKYLKERELNLWKEILNNCENGRRTGTGLTGVGDALAALGIKYGNEKSIETVELFYRTLKLACYESSIEMAEEIGYFPVWNYEAEKDCEFFKRFKQDEIVLNDRVVLGTDILARMSKVGRRNIAILTTAPAGSVSILTGTTSGIEPLFQMSYFRKKKGNHDDKNFRVDFTDQNGDKWMEFEVYHPTVQHWMDITGETNLNKSPWYKCCANDINYKNRVKLQSVAQKHVDHAISSTINLPNNVSVETVAEIYETAWGSGCKGMTIYRDGCRTGVLTSDSVKNKTIERPKSIKCDIHHSTVKGKQYFVLVGIYNDKPYEVFAGKNGILDKSIDSGIIVKKRKSFYQLTSSDKKDLYLAPITAASTEEEETVTRLTSLALQSGVDIHKVVKQLEKVEGELYGFSRALSRILKKYIPDNTKEDGEICPQCSGNNIVRQEGCKLCKTCGWTACH